MTVSIRGLAFSALLGSVAIAGVTDWARAECGIEKGSVRVLGNDFPAIQSVTKAAQGCVKDTVEVKVNLTKDHEKLSVAALSANPPEYTSHIIANSSILPLLNNGLVRPLDDYVAKYGADLNANQKIMIDGKVMAIAFMANAQHLFYRADILEKAGVAVPKTYEEMVAAAKIIKEKGLMETPLGGTYKAGWNLAEEFVNMYMGYGVPFFKEGSAEPSINNEKGVAALNMMKELSANMSKDFLTFDSNALQAEFEAGKVAIANFWGSRAGAVTDADGSTPEVSGSIKFSAAPTVGGGSIPATTLWWDGFTVAKNASDEDADATFRALLQGATSANANANADAAVWLATGYTPGQKAGGVMATVQGGAKSYPMNPYMGLLHTALGAEIVEFMQGSEDASKALADAEAAYVTAAKEAGFIK